MFTYYFPLSYRYEFCASIRGVLSIISLKWETRKSNFVLSLQLQLRNLSLCSFSPKLIRRGIKLKRTRLTNRRRFSIWFPWNMNKWMESIAENLYQTICSFFYVHCRQMWSHVDKITKVQMCACGKGTQKRSSCCSKNQQGSSRKMWSGIE